MPCVFVLLSFSTVVYGNLFKEIVVVDRCPLVACFYILFEFLLAEGDVELRDTLNLSAAFITAFPESVVADKFNGGGDINVIH